MQRLLTTVLDLLGALGLVAAVVVLVAPASTAGAIATGAVGLLLISWLVDQRARPRRTEEQT